MKIKVKYLYLLGAVVVFIAILTLSYGVLTGWFVRPPPSGNYDNFAKCLTEKGIILAGTDWCHYCKKQKEMFGSSFQYINYKNCDNDNWCRNAGVTGYPTWVFPNGQKYAGVQSLERLAELSGCPLS
ncbi:MAG: hypothetical protein QMD12_01785 [Candidatus Aenigmarchaeota archaeon]|nr:hypothetical protein [Candidatus Aenigmarchaeota archaeon]